jgi:hypothetical protein
MLFNLNLPQKVGLFPITYDITDDHVDISKILKKQFVNKFLRKGGNKIFF